MLISKTEKNIKIQKYNSHDINYTLRLIQFGGRTDSLFPAEHPLCQLANTIEWSEFEKAFGKLYDPGFGRPAVNTRLMVGLHYIEYAFNISDESSVQQWTENPYVQEKTITFPSRRKIVS